MQKSKKIRFNSIFYKVVFSLAHEALRQRFFCKKAPQRYKNACKSRRKSSLCPIRSTENACGAHMFCPLKRCFYSPLETSPCTAERDCAFPPMRLEIYLAHLLSIQKDPRKDLPEVFPALHLPGKEHLRITLLGLRRALSPYLKRYSAEICCAATLKMALSPAAPRCSPHLKALCRSGIFPRAFPPKIRSITPRRISF